MLVKIGWFILIYLVVGRIVDMGSTFVLFAIARYRDKKRKEKASEWQQIDDSSVDKLSDSISYAVDNADIVFPSKDHSTSVFKLFLFVWVLWPIIVPIGLNELWNNMK